MQYCVCSLYAGARAYTLAQRFWTTTVGRNVGTRREVFKPALLRSQIYVAGQNAATFLGVGLGYVMMLMAETAIENSDDLKLKTFLNSNNVTVLQTSFPEF